MYVFWNFEVLNFVLSNYYQKLSLYYSANENFSLSNQILFCKLKCFKSFYNSPCHVCLKSFCCMKFIQPKCLFLFYLFVYIANVCSFHPSHFPTPVFRRSCVLHNALNYKFELNFPNFVQICLFTFGIIILLWLSYLHLCNHVRYVCFTTDLGTLTKKKTYHI